MATCFWNISQSNLPNTAHIHVLASPVSPQYNPAVIQDTVWVAISTGGIDLHCVGSTWPAHGGVIVIYFWGRRGISVETDHTWQGGKSAPRIWATAKAGGRNPDCSTVAAGSCCWSGGWSVVPCINVIVTMWSRNSCCVTELGLWLGKGEDGWQIRTLLFPVSPHLSRLLVLLFLSTSLPPQKGWR